MENQVTKIYLVTNCYGDPNKVYVGKTNNTRKPVHVKTFGKQIKYDYIDEVNSLDYKDWEPLETFWIQYFKYLGFEIQNKKMKGGNGTNFHTNKSKLDISKAIKGIKRSQETRNKISSGKKNHSCYNNEWKLKISKNKMGFKHTEETKTKMSLSAKGKIFSQESREKMSKTKLGIKKSQSTKIKIGLNNSKPVEQYTKSGELIKIWNNAYEASQALGQHDGSSISLCCRGKRKSTKGYLWKFKKTTKYE